MHELAAGKFEFKGSAINIAIKAYFQTNIEFSMLDVEFSDFNRCMNS